MNASDRFDEQMDILASRWVFLGEDEPIEYLKGHKNTFKEEVKDLISLAVSEERERCITIINSYENVVGYTDEGYKIFDKTIDKDDLITSLRREINEQRMS